MAASLLLALLLSGCVELNMESEFRDDGSARHSIETTIERDSYDQLAAMGGEEADMFSELDATEDEAEAAGFEFEKIDTDEKLGSRIAREYDDGHDVEAAFNEMFEANADAEGDVPTGGITGTYESDGDEHRLNLTIDSSILFPDAGDGSTTQFGDMSDLVTITYTATLPGEIKETNGEKVDDNTVRWELPLTGTTEITAVSEGSGSGGGGSNIILIALIALLLIGGAVAAYLFTQRRRPAPAAAYPEGVAPAGVAPAYVPPTDYPAAQPVSEPVVTQPQSQDDPLPDPAPRYDVSAQTRPLGPPPSMDDAGIFDPLDHPQEPENPTIRKPEL